jgi:hypothetical protein
MEVPRRHGDDIRAGERLDDARAPHVAAARRGSEAQLTVAVVAPGENGAIPADCERLAAPRGDRADVREARHRRRRRTRRLVPQPELPRAVLAPDEDDAVLAERHGRREARGHGNVAGQPGHSDRRGLDARLLAISESAVSVRAPCEDGAVGP